VQLLIDPLRQAHLPDACYIARPRPVAQAVQGVQDRLILAE
jgi:hypothetical protein